MNVRKKLEVYVKTVEVPVQFTQLGRPIADHYCTAKDTWKTVRDYTPESRVILSIASERARVEGLELRVYDVSTFRGRLRALFRGASVPGIKED